MWRFAAALPLRNFTRFDFREVDADLERRERRGFRVAVDARAEEREPFFLRRRRPPAREPFNSEPSDGTIHELTIRYFPGRTGGAV